MRPSGTQPGFAWLIFFLIILTYFICYMWRVWELEATCRSWFSPPRVIRLDTGTFTYSAVLLAWDYL